MYKKKVYRTKRPFFMPTYFLFILFQTAIVGNINLLSKVLRDNQHTLIKIDEKNLDIIINTINEVHNKWDFILKGIQLVIEKVNKQKTSYENDNIFTNIDTLLKKVNVQKINLVMLNSSLNKYKTQSCQKTIFLIF